MKKDKAVHAFKLYNYIMQEIWKLITILLIGVLFGYLLSLKGPEGNHYIAITLIIFIFIGLLVFFVGLFRVIKRDEEERKKKEEKDAVQETNG